MGREIGQIVVVAAEERVFPGGGAFQVRSSWATRRRSLAICSNGAAKRPRSLVPGALPTCRCIPRRPLTLRAAVSLHMRRARPKAALKSLPTVCAASPIDAARRSARRATLEQMRRVIAFEQGANWLCRECVARRIAGQGRCHQRRRSPKAAAIAACRIRRDSAFAEQQYAVEHAAPAQHIEIGGQRRVAVMPIRDDGRPQRVFPATKMARPDSFHGQPGRAGSLQPGLAPIPSTPRRAARPGPLPRRQRWPRGWPIPWL